MADIITVAISAPFPSQILDLSRIKLSVETLYKNAAKSAIQICEHFGGA